MKIVIINKSDSTGGAAVVSRRLMEALRAQGADAVMLVTEQKTDSSFVFKAAPDWLIKWKFLSERLRIFIANGFSKSNLFRIDTGEVGLPLWKHPLVKEADAIILNWVNQGMLSLHGVNKIIKEKKTVIWTMHDMWNMTGICHHAGDCSHFIKECGNCPLLGVKAAGNDLSHRVWIKKQALYGASQCNSPVFVAVSTWLARKAKESSLLRNAALEIIPNAFDLKTSILSKEKKQGDNIRIIFGAARIDDPIKGLEDLKEVSKIIRKENPELASRLEILAFGGIKFPENLKGFGLPVDYIGPVLGDEEVRKIYEKGDIVVSASAYETLPGTLVEAQAFGCIPVSYDRGGQKDIVDHLKSGYLAEYSENIHERAKRLAGGIKWAAAIIDDPKSLKTMVLEMNENVKNKFSYNAIAGKYLELITAMMAKTDKIDS